MSKGFRKFDVLGLGTVVVDHHLLIDGYPEVDTKSIALDHHYQVGGPVPTALVFLSRLGIETSFVGFWGADSFGQRVADDLHAENVDIHASHILPEISTGFAHVWVDHNTGLRTLVCQRPEIDAEVVALNDEQLPSGCQILHLDGWPAAHALIAAQRVKAAGGTVSLDTGNLKPGMKELIPQVDLLNCPQRFISQYLDIDESNMNEAQQEAFVQSILGQGVQQVTITDGSNGATLWTAIERIHQPALAVEAVDTNGAGDVFAGAQLYGFLQDWPSEKRLRFASTAAALKCSVWGNRDALPTLEQVETAVSQWTPNR